MIGEGGRRGVAHYLERFESHFIRPFTVVDRTAAPLYCSFRIGRVTRSPDSDFDLRGSTRISIADSIGLIQRAHSYTVNDPSQRSFRPVNFVYMRNALGIIHQSFTAPIIRGSLPLILIDLA